MFRNKFNRKLKRILALSTLGTVYCSQNIIVNAEPNGDAAPPVSADTYSNDVINRIFSCPPATLKGLYETVRLWDTNSLNKRLKDSNGNEFDFKFNKIARQDDVLAKLYIIAFSYSDDTITNQVNLIILRDEKNDRTFPLPYDQRLPVLLKNGYKFLEDTEYDLDKLETLKSLFTNNSKREGFIKFLKEKIKEEIKEEKKNNVKNSDDTYIDDIARYLGLTRMQVIWGIAIGAIVIVGGSVWIVKSLLSSVGKAGSQIIHGDNAAPPPPAGAAPIIIAPTAPAPPPAPIIINTK